MESTLNSLLLAISGKFRFGIGRRNENHVQRPKTGASLLTVAAKAGDTTIEREFAIVSRPNLAGNGGWL